MQPASPSSPLSFTASMSGLQPIPQDDVLRVATTSPPPGAREPRARRPLPGGPRGPTQKTSIHNLRQLPDIPVVGPSSISASATNVNFTNPSLPIEVSGSYNISFKYCAPPRSRGVRDRTIHILAHGGSYTKTYWDWPQQPRNYSYVRQALVHGFHTLTYDRLGVCNRLQSTRT